MGGQPDNATFRATFPARTQLAALQLGYHRFLFFSLFELS